MEIKVVKVEKPEDVNIIIGQAHFIKTVEDLYEVLISASPNIKFGFAFCESSGKTLVRAEANSEELKKVSIKNALNIGAGHTFFIALREAFPINVLNAVKMVPEVCRIFCATANPVEVIVAETSQGRGILGVVDGFSPKGIEAEEDVRWRKDFLRKIGYKL
ncbi:MAG: adenosine monophosphate-protein transferase [Candidatus Omnitrophota bacterium]|nr:MAG: adenosine monophosphate-protein transferase [Candidatus Omnitrophota bacterium]